MRKSRTVPEDISKRPAAGVIFCPNLRMSNPILTGRNWTRADLPGRFHRRKALGAKVEEGMKKRPGSAA